MMHNMIHNTQKVEYTVYGSTSWLSMDISVFEKKYFYYAVLDANDGLNLKCNI